MPLQFSIMHAFRQVAPWITRHASWIFHDVGNASSCDFLNFHPAFSPWISLYHWHTRLAGWYGWLDRHYAVLSIRHWSQSVDGGGGRRNGPRGRGSCIVSCIAIHLADYQNADGAPTVVSGKYGKYEKMQPCGSNIKYTTYGPHAIVCSALWEVTMEMA